MIYGIISRHHGDIRVHSAAGNGTRFQIRLPQASFDAGAPAAARSGVPATGRAAERPPRRILLVEDERLVRETYAEVLTACGHEVVPAGTGEEALAAIRDRAFDAVVTDLSMPGMSGLELRGRSGRAAWTCPSFS